MFESIDIKKQLLDQKKPLPPHTVKGIHPFLDEAHTTGVNDKFTRLVSNIVDQTFDLYLRLV